MSHLQQATEEEINAQVDLLLQTYGLAGRMAGVTEADVRKVFRLALADQPVKAIEAAVQTIIKGNWLHHQSDFLPSTAVVAQAARSLMSMTSANSQMRH